MSGIVQDLLQFGLTKDNNATMERIMALKLFPSQMEAAKFAMAFAIRDGARPGSVAQAETKWHSAGFDPGGEIASTIKTLFPTAPAPYRAIEYLVNTGLERLRDHLDQHGALDLNLLLPPD